MPLLEVLTPLNCSLFPQGCLSEEGREKKGSAGAVKPASVMRSARQNCSCFSALWDLFFFPLLYFLLVGIWTPVYFCSPEMLS